MLSVLLFCDLTDLSKNTLLFVISQISLKINMKPETTLLGVEGEEKKRTYSFHTEKRATFVSTVSGSSVSSDQAVKK